MMPRMPTRNILFDLDGTLVDSLPGIEFSVDCALAECNLPPRQRELRPLIGPPIRTIFSQLLGDLGDSRLSELEQSFRSSYDSIGWSKTLPADFAFDTLQAFRSAGLALFVVTNKPSTPTRQILAHLGMARLFTDILSRNSVAPPFASKAEMLRHVIRVHQLAPGECLYVGDTSEDFGAAKEAGIPVAIVACGYGGPDTFTGDCIHLSNLSELLTIVEVMEMS